MTDGDKIFWKNFIICKIIFFFFCVKSDLGGTRDGRNFVSRFAFFRDFWMIFVSFRSKNFFRFVSFRQGQNLREKRENAPLKMDLQNGNLHYHKWLFWGKFEIFSPAAPIFPFPTPHFLQISKFFGPAALIFPFLTPITFKI